MAVFGSVRICCVGSGRVRRESLQSAGGKPLVFAPRDANQIPRIGAVKPSIVARSVKARRGVWGIGIGAVRGMERRERGNTLMFLVPLAEKTEKIDGLEVPLPLGQDHPMFLARRGCLRLLMFSPQRQGFSIFNRNLYPTRLVTRT